MDSTPKPAASLPSCARWFAPWTWYRHWTWKRWTLFLFVMLVGYVESAVLTLPLLHRLIASHPIRGTIPTAFARGVEFFYMPLGLLVSLVPGMEAILEVQAEWFDSLLAALGP